MKKIIFIALLLILFGGGFYVYKNFISTGFYQVVLEKAAPADKNIKELFAKGSDTSLPLTTPAGTRIGVFADMGSGKPRVLAFDSLGVLFTTLTNLGQVVAMPDENGDGIADSVNPILSDLKQPHGLVFHENFLYVAETDAVARYNYDAKARAASGRQKLFDLPSGGGHYTRTIKVIDNKLYTTVGSSCNVCEETEDERASMLVSNLDGSNLQVLARGLRNTVFFVEGPDGKIWGNDMGRDLLGDNLPPEDVNIIDPAKIGAHYGWPYCYGNKVFDKNFDGREDGNFCAGTVAPVFEYPAHIAPLGIAFVDSPLFASSKGDILSAQHGSWNSSVPVGYKVVKLNVEGGRVTGSEDFVTGFLPSGGDKGDVLGRPVDLVFDKEGYLYISDDHAGLIYIVSKSQGTSN